MNHRERYEFIGAAEYLKAKDTLVDKEDPGLLFKDTANYEGCIFFTVEEACMETYPCQHRVTFAFQDGRREWSILSGNEIITLYERGLEERDGDMKAHFAYLTQQ